MKLSKLQPPLFRSIMSGTRIFGEGCGRPLHFSPRAINLLFDDGVTTLLNRQGTLTPSAIVVDTESFPPIKWAKQSQNLLMTDRFEVLMNNSFDLSIHEKCEPDRSKIMRIIRPFLTVKEQSISTALLMIYGASCELKGFEKTVAGREFNILRDSETLDELIENLLGLGFGLTPSGDDFITGIISILNILNKDTTRLRSIINSYDNPFSRTMLVNALDGYYALPLYSFLRAMINGSLGKTEITNLLKVGNTSGYDTLAGIYYALDIGYALKRKKILMEKLS